MSGVESIARMSRIMKDREAVLGRVVTRFWPDGKELPEDVVMRRFLGIRVVLSIREDDCLLTITGYNLKKLDITEDEAYKAAHMNEAWGYQIMELTDVLAGYGVVVREDEEMVRLLVATNSEMQFGATCIMHQEVMERLYRRCGGRMFLLPSTVHEVIAVNVDECAGDIEALQNIVQCINGTEVADKDRLSDEIYYWDPEAKAVRLYE